jgi:predicted dehydrogenase
VTNSRQATHATHRRQFLKQGGFLFAGLGLGSNISSNLLAQTPTAQPNGANNRIKIGCIGIANQGRGNMRAHLANVVAVCDVDTSHLNEARNTVQKANGGDCPAYKDYRRLLENKNVDAVVITTPDHWHALPTINACQASKHVYCEKPLSLTIVEGRAMVRAARRHNVVVQTGSQQRSDARFRQACELVRSGRIGQVHTVRVGIPGVNFKGPAVADGKPPEVLDYDFWLGPAPQRPYNVNRVHYNFRFFWDYSGGQLTNWGAHHLDIAQWGLGMDESGPVAVEGTARYHKQGWYEVPESQELTYTYANGIRVICNNANRGGTTFEGNKGTIFVTRGRIESTPPEILKVPLGEKDVYLTESQNHHANWLDSIRNNRRPIGDVEIGHRSATVCHLGNIALRARQRILWDPAKEVIVGANAEVTAMVGRTYRAPWRLPDVK